MSGINATEMLVFLLLFVFVAVMGFMAARWKSGDTMDHLTNGGWVAASSAAGSPGSWSAATCTPRTRSWR